MKKVLESFDLAAFSFVSFQHLNIFDVLSKQRIPQNSKTAIAIIFPYYNKSAFCGNVSAYCAVADYHIVVMEQLKSIISALQQKYPHNIFVPFVDSSPIDEVDMVVKGGLGVKGHNSLLITEKWGSFVFIGEIITDLEWETVLCDYKYCLGCGLCEKTCPRGTIHVGKAEKIISVACSNHDKGALTRKMCTNGCIGCTKCVRVCPNGAMSMVDNLATIDSEKCSGCGACVEACPVHAIRNGSFICDRCL